MLIAAATKPAQYRFEGYLSPQRSSLLLFDRINWYSLNFANPWAWVYLVVVGS